VISITKGTPNGGRKTSRLGWTDDAAIKTGKSVRKTAQHVSILRSIYGADFAAGARGDMKLDTLLDELARLLCRIF